MCESCVCVCVHFLCVSLVYLSVYLSIYISVYLSVHCDGRLLCALCHALFLYFPRSFFLTPAPYPSSLSLCTPFAHLLSLLFFIFLFFSVTRTVHCLPHCLIGRGRQMTYPHTHRHTHIPGHTRTCTAPPSPHPDAPHMIITPGVASINKSEVNFAMCLARKCLVNRAMAMGQRGTVGQPEGQPEE